MTNLTFNGDCLEVMRDFSANSIDLLFCDLPYGETNCKWDCKLNLETFWKEVNRICKPTCPMFFTTTTRFGVELINSNPKNFRYDLVWVKSASVGFLNAKKMPMRKHELIYVFYRKLPYYDLSSHKHKYLGNVDRNSECYGKIDNNNAAYSYDPPLPNSILKEEKCYGEGSHDYEYKGEAREANVYEPPLPVSVIKTELYNGGERAKPLYRAEIGLYDPPLPNSVIQIRGKTKEIKEDVYNADERFINGKLYHYPRQLQKGDDSIYEPPLPNSILEIKSEKGKHATQKPIELIKWILKYYSKEGDTILDPTMGSGTTLIACKQMNRKYIGIEKDDKIYKDAVERINKI